MPHIHTSPGQIDHTVTAYIIRLDEDQPRALLHMHKKLGKLLPVGGHIELNETPWAAMSHEIEEESGYLLSELAVMQPELRIPQCDGIIVHPQPVFVNTHSITNDHFHSDMAYFFVAHAPPSHERAIGESADLRWLARHELFELNESQIWENTRFVYASLFDSFLDHWRPEPAIRYSQLTP